MNFLLLLSSNLDKVELLYYFFPFVIISGTFTFKKKFRFEKNLAKKIIHYLKFLEFLNCEPRSAKKLHYLRETIKK